jgi:hypothetical protein
MNPCYFNFEFELIQKTIAFKFEIEIWFNKWALAHLTQPAHLARLSQTGSGLGRSTDPAQPLTLSLLLLELSGKTWIVVAVTRSLRPSPVVLAADAWGKMVTSTPSTNSSSWNL